MSGHLLGLDAGSSVTKAALFDPRGAEIAVASCRVRLRRPHAGWSEIDPDEAWTAAAAVIREVVSRAGIAPSSVEAIGLSGAMVGAWVVDADGRALRPGIIWEDSRSQSLIESMQAAEPGILSRIFRSSGCVLQQGCTLPVLAWLAAHQPDVLARAAHVFGYKDFLRMRLTGSAATDRTEAAVAPGSAVARDRSAEMIELFGLSDLRHLLPPAADSESVAGALTEAAAEATGLLAGTPVAVGAGDVPATIVGAGALHDGAAITILGTTCLAAIVGNAPIFTPPDLGLLFTLPGDAWARTMVNVAGTLNLDWCVSALLPDLATAPDLYARLEAMVEDIGIGADGLTYLPYLSESGIIAPVVAPSARAQFAGLSPRHGRAHLVRAVYEGVALAIRDLFDALPRPEGDVLLTGGGSRSRAWARMIADILERPVAVPAGSEFGARGAALLAGTAIGRFSSVREASASVRGIMRRHVPDPRSAAVYAEALRRYRARRDALLRAPD